MLNKDKICQLMKIKPVAQNKRHRANLRNANVISARPLYTKCDQLIT